jgi:protocatechuate 3,4-dioxygenase beta subunit
MLPGAVEIPDMTGRGTYEFRFVVKLQSAAVNAHSFTVSRGDITSSVNSLTTSGSTSAITVDSVAPQITGGGPTTGQDFVPDSAQIDAVANEALGVSTVNTTNVTLYSCTGATNATSCTTPVTTTNLCTAVTLTNSNMQIGCTHVALSASTTYRLQVGTGVQDSAGNALASSATRIFRTSNVTSGSNTTIPHVLSSVPTPGMTTFPANANLIVDFPLGPEGNMNFNTGVGGIAAVGDLNYCVNDACAFSLKKFVSLVPFSEICTNFSTACAASWNSTTRRFTVNPASNLDASSDYEMCVRGGADSLAVKNSSSQTLGANDCIRFTTIAADSTVPTLATTSPTSPANAATDVSLFGSVTAKFSEALDQSTISLSTVRLCADSTSGTAGCESGDTRSTDTTKFGFMYQPADFIVRLDPITDDAFSASTKYCIEIVGGDSGVKDTAGNAFAATASSNCFTTASSATDPVTGAPKVLFADGDNFGVIVNFSEGMRSADLVTSGAVNTTNVALACPTGVTVSLSGKTASYNAESHELEIDGLGLPLGQTCQITITSARDLAGNAIDTTNSNNVGTFTVLNSDVTGGFLGSGTMAGDDFFGGTAGQTAATFWERPQRAEPINKSTSKETRVDVEFPAPGAMDIGSTILLTFPSGFTMSGTGGATRWVPSTQSFFNADINGHESGTVTATASIDSAAKTVTVTTAGAAITANQMIHFELDRATNPSTASENLRISIVVKNSSGVKVGQTINPTPFDISTAGSLLISGTICKGTTSGGMCSGADTAIASVKVFCDQIGGTTVSGVMAANVGHQDTITDSNGDFSITGLTAGQYNCVVPPDPTALADTGGIAPYQMVTLTTASKTDVDFRFKNLASASDAKTLTFSISSGPASETVDVYCSAGATDFQFSAPVMKSLTLSGSGAGSTTMKLQQDKSYECGVMPHIAFEQFSTGGPPPLPSFTFMPPKPQKVTMSADATLTFALTTTNRTITGSVVDGSNNGIANVYVHADPEGCFDSTTGELKDCFGAFAQTKTDGTFTLNVSDGTYEVSADGPGLPPSTEVVVNVDGANVASVTLKMVKSSTTISGTVKDESGNGIKYAHVNAEKRTIITGTDACDFTNSRPSGGFTDTPTDTSGNYTLYAAAGTWCIRAYAPAYGEVGTKTVIVSTTSLTGQDILASSSTYGTLSGTVTKASSAVSGAFVNCFGSTGGNSAQSSSDGTYSMKLKLATSGTTSFTCDGFAPGIGPLGRATVTFASGVTTASQNFTLAGNPGTITVTATGLTDGFCNAMDSTGLGSGAPIQSGTATIKAPAGTYTVRCGTPNTGPLTLTPSSVTLTAGGTATVVATVPTLRTVTGRVTDGTNNVEGATVIFSNSTTKTSFFVKTSNASGTNANFSSSTVPEGTYTLKAAKKGYEPASTTLTVSGGNATLSSPIALIQATGSAGTSVVFPVEADGVAYTGDAKVICTTTDDTVVGDNDKTAGTATLALTNGTWNCRAVGDNGKTSTVATVVIAAGVLSGTTPTLVLNTSITGFIAKSDSETLSLSTGSLIKLDGLNALTPPELNIPAGALSTSDSSTGKVSAETDPAADAIDPGTDQNVLANSSISYTVTDANGSTISDLNSDATLTLNYTDAQVADAGVDEAKLTVALLNASTGSWEGQETTVDTTNNLLTASISHFSTYGVIGGVSASATGSNNGGGGGGGGSTTPVTTTPTTTTLTTPTTTTPTTPTTSATPSTSATESAPAASSTTQAPVSTSVLIKNPSDVAIVLSQLGLTRNTTDEGKYRPLLKSDAKAFSVTLDAAQENAVTNFVAYGISQTTVKLGSGERRAVLRDYFDTVGRSDVKFADVERIAKGEKPIYRNLKKEQTQVSEAIKRFEKIQGHRPDFKDAKDDLLWNTLMYRIRFARDLTKEKKGISEFKAKFKRTPSSPMDWAAVRGMAYVVNK